MVFKLENSREDLLLDEFHRGEHNRWARFKTRVLGRSYHLGRHSPIGVYSRQDYYLIWCPVHKKYEVSYRWGYDEVLVCRDCEKERRQQVAEHRADRALRLVVEQDGDDLF